MRTHEKHGIEKIKLTHFNFAYCRHGWLDSSVKTLPLYK